MVSLSPGTRADSPRRTEIDGDGGSASPQVVNTIPLVALTGGTDPNDGVQSHSGTLFLLGIAFL
jgi:hypothetical protein